MFKFSISRTPPSTTERPFGLQETDPDTTVWPPAIAHQVPLTQKKKPIFKEPVLQGIIFLSALVILAMDHFHAPDKVMVTTACFIMVLDMALVFGTVWKAVRAERR